jgi:predicted transposase/invertase (TIGR01784 family)
MDVKNSLDDQLPPDIAKKLAEVVKMDMAMQKAGYDEETLHARQMREMGLSDWISGLNHAREEGMREGMREIAKSLKAMGDSVEKIAKATGLPVEEIENL